MDDAGWSPLFFACQYGNLACVRMLLKAGSDTNRLGMDGVNPLFLAVQNGHIVIAEELILAGCDVDVQTVEGYTCLYR